MPSPDYRPHHCPTCGRTLWTADNFPHCYGGTNDRHYPMEMDLVDAGDAPERSSPDIAIY
jgi:hypothetical protein